MMARNRQPKKGFSTSTITTPKWSVLLMVLSITIWFIQGQQIQRPKVINSDPTQDNRRKTPLIGLDWIDRGKTLFWGPGLFRPDVNLPVRYFFAQLVHHSGQNVTGRPVPNLMKFHFASEERCRVRTEAIDRRDGSFVFRYKLITPCRNLTLHVVDEGDHPFGKSPFTIQGTSNLCPDEAFCPKADYLHQLECPAAGLQQIMRDLNPWLFAPNPESNDHSAEDTKQGISEDSGNRTIDFDRMVRLAVERWAEHPGSTSFCHYQIIDNRIYRKCYGDHVDFKMFSDQILLSIARKAVLPNTEFIMNLGDWPLEKGQSKDGLIPVISWCGSTKTHDILLPTYEITEATLEMLGRQSIDIQSVQGMSGRGWPDKVDRAIFRGRDSRQERLDLVLLGRRNPKHLSADITHFFFFRDQMDRYGPEMPSLPFGKFFDFRYVISIDGSVAAYRIPYLLAGDSLVLKQESPYYEHFYSSLVPFEHYVPINRNLSDVIQKIEWARANPEKVKEIIRNARRFVQDHLQPANIFCYHIQLFHKYSELLKTRPSEPRREMEFVPQPEPMFPCPCNDETVNKDEL